MTDGDHVDILALAGIDRSTFNSTGEDIEVEDREHRPVARVFRRGGKLVYRAGSEVWDEDLKH